jgi:hypothetical protein
MGNRLNEWMVRIKSVSLPNHTMENLELDLLGIIIIIVESSLIWYLYYKYMINKKIIKASTSE